MPVPPPNAVSGPKELSEPKELSLRKELSLPNELSAGEYRSEIGGAPGPLDERSAEAVSADWLAGEGGQPTGAAGPLLLELPLPAAGVSGIRASHGLRSGKSGVASSGVAAGLAVSESAEPSAVAGPIPNIGGTVFTEA